MASSPVAQSRGYSEVARAQIVEHVLEELVKGERGLKRILSEDDGMCSIRQFHGWMLEDEALSAQVERAREIAATGLLEDTFEIAEDVAQEKDAIAKAKLRIYQREMFAAKIAPKRFGSKVDVTSGGDKLEPSQLNDNRIQTLLSIAQRNRQKQLEQGEAGDEG